MMGVRPDGRATRTATTSGGTSRAAATAGRATRGRRRRADVERAGRAGDAADAAVGGLPPCPGPSTYSQGNAEKTSSQATCATWNPADEHRPAGLRLVHPAAGAAVRIALAAALAALAVAGCGGAERAGGGGSRAARLDRAAGRVHARDAARRADPHRAARATRACGGCASTCPTCGSATPPATW